MPPGSRMWSEKFIPVSEHSHHSFSGVIGGIYYFHTSANLPGYGSQLFPTMGTELKAAAG